MSQYGIGPAVVATMVVLTAVPVNAADTPEVAEQKRQLQQAYQGFFDDGVCSVFIQLGKWQTEIWPEGRPVVLQFLQQKLLPRYLQDPAAMKDKTPELVEAEFLQFCVQVVSQAGQILKNMDSDPNADKAKPLQDTMLAAIFLGECKTVSELYLKGNLENTEKLRPFVHTKIYAKDPRYQQLPLIEEGADDEEVAADVAGILARAEANKKSEVLYWRDCDTVDAKFKEIFEQLKPAP